MLIESATHSLLRCRLTLALCTEVTIYQQKLHYEVRFWFSYNEIKCRPISLTVQYIVRSLLQSITLAFDIELWTIGPNHV